MAAQPKVTPEQIAAIMRRHAAGETYTAIGRELGFPHSTISRSHKKELARLATEKAEADADAAAERTRDENIKALENGWKMDFDPHAKGPLYPSWEYCQSYWWARKNSALNGEPYRRASLDYNTVTHRREYLPIEEHALSAGRRLYVHPPGSRKSLGPA